MHCNALQWKVYYSLICKIQSYPSMSSRGVTLWCRSYRDYSSAKVSVALHGALASMPLRGWGRNTGNTNTYLQVKSGNTPKCDGHTQRNLLLGGGWGA